MTSPETEASLIEFAEFSKIDSLSLAATVVAVHEVNLATCLQGRPSKPYVILALKIRPAVHAGDEKRANRFGMIEDELEYPPTVKVLWEDKHSVSEYEAKQGALRQHRRKVAVRRTDGDNYNEEAFADFAVRYEQHLNNLTAVREAHPGYKYDSWDDEVYFDWEIPVNKYVEEHVREEAHLEAMAEMVPFIKNQQPIPAKLGARVVAHCAMADLMPWPNLTPVE